MKLTSLSLLLLLGLSLGAQAQIYRWVDADGVTHFSDAAPKDQKADRIKLKVQEPSSSPASSGSHGYDPQKLKENEQKFLRAVEAEKRLKDQRKAELAQQEAERQKYCKSLLKELAYYRQGWAMVQSDDKGQVNYVPDAEIKKRHAELEAKWQKTCVKQE